MYVRYNEKDQGQWYYRLFTAWTVYWWMSSLVLFVAVMAFMVWKVLVWLS